jgi:hypothetical protein
LTETLPQQPKGALESRGTKRRSAGHWKDWCARRDSNAGPLAPESISGVHRETPSPAHARRFSGLGLRESGSAGEGFREDRDKTGTASQSRHEERESSLQSVFVLGTVQDDAEDDLLDSGGVRPGELSISEVDVVDDFRNVSERRVRIPSDPNERLECARIALVRKVPPDHVEPQLTGLPFLLRIDEPELRIRINEPANQPGGGDPIDVQPTASDPNASLGRSLRVFPEE